MLITLLNSADQVFKVVNLVAIDSLHLCVDEVFISQADVGSQHLQQTRHPVRTLDRNTELDIA